MVELLKSLLGEGQDVVGLAIRLLAAVTVVRVWVQTHARVTVLGTILICAVTIYAVDHFDDLGAEVKETVDENRNAPVPAAGG